jgi:hypothetical protein
MENFFIFRLSYKYYYFYVKQKGCHYLCEENAMISDFFCFIKKNMQTLLLMKG